MKRFFAFIALALVLVFQVNESNAGGCPELSGLYSAESIQQTKECKNTSLNSLAFGYTAVKNSIAQVKITTFEDTLRVHFFNPRGQEIPAQFKLPKYECRNTVWTNRTEYKGVGSEGGASLSGNSTRSLELNDSGTLTVNQSRNSTVSRLFGLRRKTHVAHTSCDFEEIGSEKKSGQSKVPE